MSERILVHKGTYHDSAFLMRVTRELKSLAGVEEAVVLMGTAMNRELLADAGFRGGVLEAVTPMDMVVALRAAGAEALDAAEGELDELLKGGAGADGGGRQDDGPAPTLGEAFESADANLVSVSVPGAYAAYVAHRALDAGKHVFLFSNNVALEDELELKRRGRDLGLLVMGPDCGTAIIAGVGLGFANRVRRGSIGLVGASGTGLQDVSCTVFHAGAGVSQAIGTGSRDLSREVGGMMTEFGLRLLAGDPETKVVALIAKHPAEEVAARMHEVLRGLGKPAVVRYLGKPSRPSADGVHYAETLDEAALVAVALANGQKPPSLRFAADAAARAKELLAGRAKSEGRLVGLFGGGSLAAEARLILDRHGIVSFEPERPLKTEGPVEIDGHLIVDTGEDFYTVGKPHPMVDQTVRCALLRKTAADPSVGVVLMDLVIGDGCHPDPAPELAAAVAEGVKARKGKPLHVIVSITGTDKDPQSCFRQRSSLKAMEIEVAPTAARAAYLAAALLGGTERSER